MTRLQGSTGELASPEHSDTTVRIFLSHKPEDAKAAMEIRNHLKFLGQERLHVFVSEEVPFAANYRGSTLREIAQADKLILLYTDPHQEWDSCLYESGFFDGRFFASSSKKRLIVLRDQAVQTPKSLTEFHAVKVSRTDRDELRQFLHEVFAESPRDGVGPINPDLMKEDFSSYRKDLEEAIINAVSGSQEPRVFARDPHRRTGSVSQALTRQRGSK